MPPEETNCLVAIRMDIHGLEDATSGVRVFAKENDKVAAVSWYTVTAEPPPGYESVLDGLVFVRSSTIGSVSKIHDITPTKIGSTYQWKDNAHPMGLMIAIALPSGYTLESWQPQIEEAKRFQDRVAVYWHLFPSNPSDNRVTVSVTVKPSGYTLDNEVERLNRAIVLSRARPTNVPYDVALSFAGEDRNYVDQVAKELNAQGVKVFYDKFEVAGLWGKDLYSHLTQVYNGQARFTIMFVSEAYASKLWTNHERKAAQAKAFTQNSEYILPVRIDDTEIPGMLPTTSYIRASEYSPAQLASLIVKKLTASRSTHRKHRRPIDAMYKPASKPLVENGYASLTLYDPEPDKRQAKISFLITNPGPNKCNIRDVKLIGSIPIPNVNLVSVGKWPGSDVRSEGTQKLPLLLPVDEPIQVFIHTENSDVLYKKDQFPETMSLNITINNIDEPLTKVLLKQADGHKYREE